MNLVQHNYGYVSSSTELTSLAAISVKSSESLQNYMHAVVSDSLQLLGARLLNSSPGGG